MLKTIERTLRWSTGLMAAMALFTIMWLTLVDVTGRRFFDHSVPGGLELTEILMVIVIFGALPMVSWRNEHVVFDSLDASLAPAVRKWQQRVVHVLSAVLLLGLAYLMWHTAAEFAQSGETTAQLKLSKAPFIYGMAVLCACTGLVHLGQTWAPAGGRDGQVDGTRA